MRASSCIALAVAGLSLGASIPIAAATDPFYSSLQEEGRLALERSDFSAAERALQIAAFGLLEEPQSLASCLTLLALAQDGAKKPVPFRETVRRIAELEQRFGAYRGGSLAAATRSSFDEALRRNLTPAALAALPWVETPAPPPAPPALKGRASRRARASDAKASSPATPAPAPVLTPTPAPAMEPTVTTKPQPRPMPAPEPKQPPAPAPAPVPAPVPAPPKQPATATQQEMARIRRAMNAARTMTEIKEVSRQAQELAGALPGNPEVGRLAAEAAYRSSEWVTAASLYSQMEIDPENDPLTCFYASVSFFEVGKTAEAAGLLRRCQALLATTPAVTRYIERILGRRAGGTPRP